MPTLHELLAFPDDIPYLIVAVLFIGGFLLWLASAAVLWLWGCCRWYFTGDDRDMLDRHGNYWQR